MATKDSTKTSRAPRTRSAASAGAIAAATGETAQGTLDVPGVGAVPATGEIDAVEVDRVGNAVEDLVAQFGFDDLLAIHDQLGQQMRDMAMEELAVMARREARLKELTRNKPGPKPREEAPPAAPAARANRRTQAASGPASAPPSTPAVERQPEPAGEAGGEPAEA